MDDALIVALYWERNEDAIHETASKYGRYLTKIAHNILADWCDSYVCINDTYLKAWGSMPSHRPGVLSTYLGKIAREVSIDVFRKRTRQKRGGSEYAASLSELETCTVGGGPEEALDFAQLVEALNAFLRTLTPEARHAFIGRYFFMDSTRAVANYCDASESKIKSLLHRTRQALKTHLEKEGALI